MKKCKFCNKAGCPECLGFGYNISTILSKVDPNLKISEFSSLSIKKQRLVKAFISKTLIKKINN